jgi:histidinol-phosphate aminotransferase
MIKHNKHLATIKPYVTSNRFTLDKSWTLCDWNESLFAPSAKVTEVFDSLTKQINFRLYPDITQQQLKSKISEYVDVPKENIEVYNGSDDALKDIFSVFVDESTSVLTYAPSYTQVDTFIDINTANHTSSLINNIFDKHEYDFEECSKHNVVYIVNPNNPTGHLIPISVIESLLKDNPNTLFIIDEAYYEFCKTSCVQLTKQFSNIVVTRTFSKAFGLASFRLGYIISNKENIKSLQKIKNGKSVNSIAQLAGIAALSDIDYLNSCVEQTELSKQYFYDNLNTSYQTLKGYGNFIIVKTDNIKNTLKVLAENKILVRDRSYLEGLQNCFRVSIGPLDLTKKILQVLQ